MAINRASALYVKVPRATFRAHRPPLRAVSGILPPSHQLRPKGMLARHFLMLHDHFLAREG